MRNKKSQMEILGLAIVLVLIILAMVFVMRFAFKQADDLRGNVVDSQSSASYIAAYLKTTTDCKPNMKVEDLLEDCASATSYTCDSSSLTACEKAEEIANTIFSRTFDIWQTPYYFSMYSSQADYERRPPSPTITSGQLCRGERRSKTQPLPTSSGGTMYVVLDICR